MDFIVIRKILQQSENIDEIYDAIDKNDMVVLVRAAMNALLKAKCMQIGVEKYLATKTHNNLKSKSLEFRGLGNEYYREGQYEEALIQYNKALAYAPNDFDEKLFAYVNRSAVLFSMRNIACQNDIDHCISIGCSARLAKKLGTRWTDAFDFLNEHFDMISYNNFFSYYFWNKFKFNSKRNADVPCASADVTFVSQDGAKRAAAGKVIRAGEIVAIERAFVSVAPGTVYTSCYFCHKLTPNLHPCKRCTLALFCSDVCREECMVEYHHIECQIIELLISINNDSHGEPLLVLRSAIKLSLKMGWDAFIKASEDIGSTRMKTATVRQTYNSDEPLSILSYNDENKLILEGRLFNGSIFCASALYCLDTVPDYFPEESKRVAAKEAMSRIMMHLYVTFTNKISIRCPAYNFRSKRFEAECRFNYGWFSMCSKLKHSCEPNLMVVALNDSVALVALRTIKKNEELTISYINHPYDDVLIQTNKTHCLRAMHLFQTSRHLCNCQCCIENRHISYSVDNMTEEDAKLVSDLGYFNLDQVERVYTNACRKLDIFPIFSKEHVFGYKLLNNIIDLAACVETCNQIYA